MNNIKVKLLKWIAQAMGRYYCPFCNAMLKKEGSVVIHHEVHHPDTYIF
jgi:competence CoiA-like predicted nuclease